MADLLHARRATDGWFVRVARLDDPTIAPLPVLRRRSYLRVFKCGRFVLLIGRLPL